MLLLCSLTFYVCLLLVQRASSQNATGNFISSELQALRDLYDQTNGTQWQWKDASEGAHWNFSSTANPCIENWQGITCELPPPYDTYYVLDLALAEYNLIGPLPNSIDQLTHLSQLSLGGNGLHGTIPPSLGNLSALSYLNMSLNSFSSTVPGELSGATQLDTILLYRNKLTGTLPDSLSRLRLLRNLLIQYNALTGSLYNVFDNNTQTTLHYVALNNNQLTGTLPESLLSNANLQNLYMDNNCFHGTLPTSVCNSTQLEVLSLGCLKSASQCVRYPFQPISNSFTLHNPLQGTLPTCILELPSLQLLNLAGNQLTGSLPNKINLGANLSNIVLLYNKFTGQIPESIQTHSLFNLYLSHNHFSGKLLHQSKPFATQQYWNIVYNRLTGSIPSAVRSAYSIDMLTGNMFSCRIDKTDLPNNDGGSINYQCGSDDYNVPYILWVVLMFVCTISAYMIYRARYSEYVNFRWLFVNARVWVLAVRDVKLPSVVQVRQVGKHFTIVAAMCATALLLIGAPVYAALTVYYGTYEQQYAWTLSFVLLSGIPPFVFGLLLFTLTLALFTTVYIARDKHTGNAMREKLPVVGTVPPKEVVCVCIAYFLINLAVSFLANVAYVYVIMFKPSTFQVLMSLYKLAWNGFCVPYLSRYMVRRLRAKPVDFFTLELYVSLMTNVIVPVLAVVLISPRCFYGIFVPNAKFSNRFNDVLTYYEFPFRYEYQCSYVYMEYYATAFVYLAIFATFGVPVYEMCVLYCYNRAEKGSRWFNWCNYWLPRILKPQTSDSTKIREYVAFEPYFDATKFLIAQLTCLALILSLGVVAPLLAVCLAVCMIGTCSYSMLKVGRFIHNARELNQPKYLDIIELECKVVISNEMLRKSYWLLFFFSCWFMMPFLFDTLGHAVGFENSYWILLVMPLFPFSVFIVFRTLRTHYIWNYLFGVQGDSSVGEVLSADSMNNEEGESSDMHMNAKLRAESQAGVELSNPSAATHTAVIDKQVDAVEAGNVVMSPLVGATETDVASDVTMV